MAKKKAKKKARKSLKRKPKQEFFSSGCLPLDLAMGGGWAEGRISNLVGDSATGKTLLAIESCANFFAKYPKGNIYYIEAEAAFNLQYAESIGLPVQQVELVEDVYTIEEFIRRMDVICAESSPATPTLVLLDSLDALSDEAEEVREVGKGSYNMAKAKGVGELFRRLAGKIKKSNTTLQIISQTRDNIGVTFGPKSKRSGGRALQFYCSQVVWLKHQGRLMQTRKGIKRAIGCDVRGKVDKCRFGPPFREVDVPIYFSYGMDDLESCIAYLIEVSEWDQLFDSEAAAKKFSTGIPKLTQDEYEEELVAAHSAVRTAWADVESTFLPTRRKYRA